MNKEEFIKKLKKSLNILEDSEIADIVSEYEGYIEEKVKDGKSEEEAVKELGDFDEIVSDLLAAYKVKSRNIDENSFTRFINKLGDGLDNFMNSLSEKSGRDIIKIIIEIIIILFILGLLKIPFHMIKDLGNDIFYELGYPISRIFNALWSFIIEFGYVITSVVIFIKMLEKRYFSSLTDEIVDKVDQKESEKEPKEKSKPTKKRESKSKEKNTNEEIVSKDVVRAKGPGLISVLADICILFLKFIVIIFIFGLIAYLIGMSIASGIMIYLLIKGVSYFGIFLLVITMFLAGVFILELCLSFVFNKKIGAISTFSKLISLIILTGIGLTMSAIDIANTEIIYDSNYTETKSITKEISMEKDLTFYNYDSIVTDNTLGNRIIIEYIYPDLANNIKLDIDLEKTRTGYWLSTDFNHAVWSNKILNTVIDNLKDKKFYVYDFNIKKIIHASEENAVVITKNHHSYYYDDNPWVFNKVYYVNNIMDNNDSLYLYLTLIDENNDETRTVKVPRSLAKDILINNNYEFTFETNDIGEENYDLEDIFNECKLLNIVPKI